MFGFRGLGVMLVVLCVCVCPPLVLCVYYAERWRERQREIERQV